MSISAVSNAPVAQLPPKLDPAKAPQPPADNDKGADKSTAPTSAATATTASSADLAKALVAANAKINTDGTVGPHHKKRVLHPGQAGYKPPVASAPPASTAQSTGTGQLGQTLNVKA